jgi:hypothetical protein
MLRPLRTMNTAIKRISARNVHERLALRGPRDELLDLGEQQGRLLESLLTLVKSEGGLDHRGPLDPLPAHTVRNATVGGIRDARTAGIRPANAPMRMAEAMPPVHASTGITMSQFFELA